jgi:hypothetical protein
LIVVLRPNAAVLFELPVFFVWVFHKTTTFSLLHFLVSFLEKSFCKFLLPSGFTYFLISIFSHNTLQLVWICFFTMRSSTLIASGLALMSGRAAAVLNYTIQALVVDPTTGMLRSINGSQPQAYVLNNYRWALNGYGNSSGPGLRKHVRDLESLTERDGVTIIEFSPKYCGFHQTLERNNPLNAVQATITVPTPSFRPGAGELQLMGVGVSVNGGPKSNSSDFAGGLRAGIATSVCALPPLTWLFCSLPLAFFLD